MAKTAVLLGGYDRLRESAICCPVQGTARVSSFVPRFSILTILAWTALVTACATRAPVTTSPKFPSYPFPLVPDALASADLVEDHSEAWRQLQAGDLVTAERSFAAMLTTRPDFYPSVAGLGFVRFAKGELAEALANFDLALGVAGAYVPALLGRGETLLAENRVGEALDSFQAALTAEPTLTGLRQRVEELRFTNLTNLVAEARAARAAGQEHEARDSYERVIAASPESGFLYVELAEIESRLGLHDEALERLAQAITLDPNAVAAWILMADIYEASADLDRAEQALLRADAIESNAEVTARLREYDAQRLQNDLPPQYREIETATAITRGQFAALLGIRFEAQLVAQQGSAAAIVTDARDHWAYQWVIAVSQSGLMVADANYRFQPDRALTREELALIGARLLRLRGVPQALRASDSQSILDLASAHRSYPAVAEAVEQDLLRLDQGRFRPNGSVSGREAFDALDLVAGLTER